MPVRRLVEARVDVLDRKTASGQQMLRLEAEEIAEAVMMDEPFLASMRMRHVVDELAREGLIREITETGETAA